MKKIISHAAIAMILAILLLSCKKETVLRKYDNPVQAGGVELFLKSCNMISASENSFFEFGGKIQACCKWNYQSV